MGIFETYVAWFGIASAFVGFIYIIFNFKKLNGAAIKNKCNDCCHCKNDNNQY